MMARSEAVREKSLNWTGPFTFTLTRFETLLGYRFGRSSGRKSAARRDTPARGLSLAVVQRPLCLNIWGFPEIWDTLLGVPIIEILRYWGLYWGPLFRETTISQQHDCFFSTQCDPKLLFTQRLEAKRLDTWLGQPSASSGRQLP